MGYTNSGLVAYKKLSPNHSGKRTHSIDRITPHCVVGQCSAEGLGDWFAKSSTQASSNYGIDKDGRVGLYVEEKNRSWCSSSNANDQRAVTIECASDTTEPYAFRDAVYKKLITLCVDICKRNGKKKLIWFGDKDKTLNYSPKSDEMVLTVHRWFANKSCPGNWMYARMGDLASKVTAQLGGNSGSGSSGSDSSSGTNTKFPETPFLVTVIIDDLNIRTSGSMMGMVVGQTGKGVFTITKVKNGWGKLKSGAGWIYLENASYCTIGKAVSGSDKKVSPQEEKEESKEEKVSGLQAASLKDLSEADVVKKVGPLFTADQKRSGILASVSLAQFILESGYGKTSLVQEANNCFGMKESLSGNTWAGSTWDGKSIYRKKTQEDDGRGNLYTITANFRKYPCVEDSIGDHSAYLNGAKNGSRLRYAGLKGCADYKTAIRIIKDGGYATDTKYVYKICNIIERWNLTQYDVKASAVTPEKKQEDVKYYRVRKAWTDKPSQIGAFTVLENAKLCVDANPGYAAFDDYGKQVYPERFSFTKYALSDEQLLKIARLCQQEQGTVAGAKAEASLMANQLETSASRKKKYGTGADGLYNWVRNGGWFSRAAHWMDNGSVSAAVLAAVGDVFVDGNRTLPLYVDEHDCLSDIKSISTGSVKDRNAYVQGKTVVKNRYGSTWTFWCFPDKSSDPFGYTDEAYRAAEGR